MIRKLNFSRGFETPAMPLDVLHAKYANLKRAAVMLLSIATLAQLVIERSWLNTFCLLMVWVASFVVLKVVLQPGRLQHGPLSTLTILGFWLSCFYLPTLVTAFEWNPVTNNLRVPTQVFIHSMLCLLVLIAAQEIALRSSKPTGPLTHQFRVVLGKLWIYRAPEAAHLWFMGVIGLAAMFYAYFFVPAQSANVGGATNMIVRAFVPFVYAPFLLVFPSLYRSDAPRSLHRHIPFLVMFFVLLLIVAVGSSWRGGFMTAILMLGLFYIMSHLTGGASGPILRTKGVLVGLGLVLLSQPAADLATAVVVVRGNVRFVGRVELLQLTWEAFLDKETLLEERRPSETSGGVWGGYYVENIFMERFCNLKFADEMLLLEREIEDAGRIFMRQLSIDRLISTLPEPMLNVLGLGVDKATINQMSDGSHLIVTVVGSTSGSRYTGDFRGVGMASMGWGYLPVLGLISIPFFWLLDLLAVRQWTGGAPLGRGRPAGATVISVAALLILPSLYDFFSMENVTYIGSFILRRWPELVIVYAITFAITRFLIVPARSR